MNDTSKAKLSHMADSVAAHAVIYSSFMDEKATDPGDDIPRQA